MATILGLNAYHGDAAAAIVVDGELVAAAEEERFNRVKHVAGFTALAAAWCLEEAGIAPEQLDHVAVSRNPRANAGHKLLRTVRHGARARYLKARLQNAAYTSPFMVLVYKTRPSKRELIPAVNHVDDTGRLQTVERNVSPRYWRLISEFEKLTGVPILLNTSFNENEPIVMTPAEAVACFATTRMDMLVAGHHVVRRTD